MLRTLRAFAFLFLVALAAPANAQVLFHDDFESGLSNWTAENLWHVEDASLGCAAPLLPFPSGTKAAWYGSAATCDYSPGAGFSSWFLTLVNPVALPATGGQLALRFRRSLATESCFGGYDVSGGQFSTDGGASWDPFSSFLDCRGNNLAIPPVLPWVTTRLSIDSLAGESVLVRFSISVDPPWDEDLGWWIDDVEFVAEPGMVSCTATTNTCPCGNAWDATSPARFENYGGCRNSRRAEVVLYGDGVASVSNDSVVLRVADMPPGSPALLVQAASTSPTPFGDGKLCLSGTLMRLWTHTGTQPIEDFPAPSDAALAVQGGVPPTGGVRVYQVVYRDAATFCTSSTWNTSNAYRIEWTP